MKPIRIEAIGIWLWAAVFLLCLHPIFSSTMIQHQSLVTPFVLIAAAVLVMLLLAYKHESPPFTMGALTLAGICIMANVTSLPLLQYTSEYPVKEVAVYARSIALDSLLSLLFLPAAAWIVLMIIDHLSQKHPRLLLYICSGLSFVIGIITLLFSSSDSNTAVVCGVVIGLPMIVLFILTVSIALHEYSWQKWIGYAAVGWMMVSLMVRGETGIPILIYLTSCLYYFIFYPYPKKAWLMAVLISLPVCGIAALYICYKFQLTLPFDFATDMLRKAEDRFFSKEMTSHIIAAARSIADGRIFGNFRYTVYVPEASSDMVISTMIHYLGFAFLLCLGASVIYFGYTGCRHYLAGGNNSISHTTGKLAMLFTISALLYNILMVTGYVPILGVQPTFTGASHLCFLISGLLLGFMSFQKNGCSVWILKLKQHQKGENYAK